jgi:hypothetical protein
MYKTRGSRPHLQRAVGRRDNGSALRSTFNDGDGATATALTKAGFTASDIFAELNSVHHNNVSSVISNNLPVTLQSLVKAGVAAGTLAGALKSAPGCDDSGVAYSLHEHGYSWTAIAAALKRCPWASFCSR